MTLNQFKLRAIASLIEQHQASQLLRTNSQQYQGKNKKINTYDPMYMTSLIKPFQDR